MVENKTKFYLYNSILLNLLQWRSKNYAQNCADVEKLEIFPHGAIRQILPIVLTPQVPDERLKNSEIRKRFGGISLVTLIIAKKQLNWTGK